ncbi:MAG: 6-carboxytetrahydropterin synthase [Thermoflavifilum sp.]|nr:6-carboxytetrahydropterin synthase [Thermoflavifilum sp.]
MIYITRRVHFNAAHKLYNPAWSKEKNEQVFGKCANENWHGHNYVLYVTVKGEIDPETGYVTDAKALYELIQRKILDQVDHRNLNLDVPFMRGKICSTENFAKAIWEQLAPEIKQGQLHCVKLYETENIYVEYYGE